MHDDDFKDINLNLEPNLQAVDANLNLRHKTTRAHSHSTGKKIWKIAVGIVLFLVIGMTLAGWWMLTPANNDTVHLTVKDGASLAQVIDELAKHGVLRNAQIAKIYLKATKFSHNIQAGDYEVAPRQPSIQALLTNLKKTQPNTKKITFYPGATLNHRNSKTDTTPSHREALKKVGYSDAQIDTAFKFRQHKLFDLLPELTNLEGLIFGDTYEIFTKGTAEDALKRTFDEYLKFIQDNKLVELYKKQGLTLYQGIILASIVEREVNSADDRAKVAQVFLKRYKQKMALGSDVTYQYASRLAGVENDLYIKSPFNTRQVVGLTPTPIATPSKSSLLAVAQPSDTDYLFFVAGDDEKTYFAKTLAEHNRNVKQYCHKKCAVH
jgi:hypothetical protein